MSLFDLAGRCAVVSVGMREITTTCAGCGLEVKGFDHEWQTYHPDGWIDITLNSDPYKSDQAWIVCSWACAKTVVERFL